MHHARSIDATVCERSWPVLELASCASSYWAALFTAGEIASRRPKACSDVDSDRPGLPLRVYKNASRVAVSLQQAYLSASKTSTGTTYWGVSLLYFHVVANHLRISDHVATSRCITSTASSRTMLDTGGNERHTKRRPQDQNQRRKY